MSTPYDRMPPTARAIVLATAQEYGVEVPAIFAERTERRSHPEAETARRAAINRICDERIDEKYRWGIGQVAEWFGVARNNLNAARRQGAGYERRVEPKRAGRK